MRWDYIVRAVHVLIVAFFVCAPFSRNCDMIVMHAIMVPFLYVHWLTNNDTCALTEVEKLLSKKTQNTETFVGSIVSPVYKIESGDVKILTLLLWVFSLSQSFQCRRKLLEKFTEPVRMMIPKSFKM